jgi:hypothetical protein
MNSPESLSEAAQSLKTGAYRHFKGGIYTVLGVARHSEDPTQEFVVYKNKDNKFWIRPLAMFLEHVDRDSYSGLRFIYIGEENE